MKNLGTLFVRLFLVSAYFAVVVLFLPQLHPFSEPEPDGSGSGSEQTVSATPAPVPHPWM